MQKMNSALQSWVKRIRLTIIIFFIVSTMKGQEAKYSHSPVFFNAQSPQWASFVKKFKSSDTLSGQIKILQIGDSHIQGGYYTNQFRNLMNHNGYSMSTGLTFPYVLANTNGTEEISYYSPNRWRVEKVTNTNSGKLSIAGYLIASNDSFIKISLKFNSLYSAYRPGRLRFYHNSPRCAAQSSMASHIETRQAMDSVYITELILPEPTDSIHVSIKPANSTRSAFQLLAIEMDNDASKSIYHALGINGITFDRYIGKVNYLPWMKQISPDCLVISFGTNDIYSGKVNASAFERTVGGFIDSLQHAFPEMVIIITSPGDHLLYKKYNNHAISIAVKVLQDIARQKNCLFWDFYAEMGGEGSCRQWYKKGWMFKDYVHLSKEGYKQQGTMFYHAFMNTVEQTWQNSLLKAGIN